MLSDAGSPRSPCERRLERILEFNVPEGGLSRTSECTRWGLAGAAFAAPAVTQEDQKLMRRPKRNWRSSGLALVMLMKFPEDWRLPSGLKVILDAFAPGLLKCGVLVRLAASARN